MQGLVDSIMLANGSKIPGRSYNLDIHCDPYVAQSTSELRVRGLGSSITKPYSEFRVP